LVCLSIMMKSTNQQCNSFQSVVGIFLHSANTLETVRKFLLSLGISIFMTTINQAVSSLSTKADKNITLGKTIQALFVYDNLDIDLKQSVPTVKNNNKTMVHLTTGTMLPLHPTTLPEHLNCSQELWEKYKPRQRLSIPLMKLIKLHTNTPDSEGLRNHDHFNCWKFLFNLVHYGLEYFCKFKSKLGQAEVYKAVPVMKTKQVPNRTLDVAPSMPTQNAEAIETFLAQVALRNPTEIPGVMGVGNQIVLISGDLLTGKRIRSLLAS
ncbi:hypothetical protein BDN71DRAFT_1389744, partial [Pleurotus eryngii]